MAHDSSHSHEHDGHSHRHHISEPGLMLLGDDSDASDGPQPAADFVVLAGIGTLSVVLEALRHARAGDTRWSSRTTSPPRRPPRPA
jgi:hypothetical protein